MNEEGKRWEKDFRASMNKCCIRLYDTTNGFAGVKNPCDFIYYNYPYQFMFELKSIQINRFNFSYITKNQWENAKCFSKIIGVNPIICVEFREIKRGFAIPFKEILKLNSKGKRSITVEQCEENPDILEIPMEYKRTHCKIYAKDFDEGLRKLAENKDATTLRSK